MPGLSNAGFEGKTLAEVVEDQESRAIAEFGPNIRTSPDEVLGHLIGIQAEGLYLVWQQLQILYDAFNPDNAQGQMLDNLARIVGVSREPATRARGTVTATGNDGTIIPAGSIVAAPDLDDAQFVTLADATIGASVSGEVDISIEAEEAGALTVLAGEVSVIITPVAGWSGVSNAADLTPGAAVETDSALRLRMGQSLGIISGCTDQSIRARVLALDDVTYVLVISNRSSVTVGGVPPHAFETIIWPATGVDEDRLAETLWEVMPAGIEPFGTTTKVVTDAQGVSQDVSWTYASGIALTMNVTVDPDAESDVPGDCLEQIKANILALQDGWEPGHDVSQRELTNAIVSVQGADNWVYTIERKIGGTPGPSAPMDPDEMPLFESEADVTVAFA